MSSYCDKSDLKNAIPEIYLKQLTDDADTDDIDDEKLDAAILKASDYIDGYLKGRYPTPIPGTIPVLIVDLAIRLSVYFLFKRSLLVTLPDPIKEDWKDTNNVLIGIQKGKINPFEATDEPVFFATNKTPAQKLFTDTPVLPSGTPSMLGSVSQGQNNWNNYLV
jgi:phage gp36-like protein